MPGTIPLQLVSVFGGNLEPPIVPTNIETFKDVNTQMEVVPKGMQMYNTPKNGMVIPPLKTKNFPYPN